MLRRHKSYGWFMANNIELVMSSFSAFTYGSATESLKDDVRFLSFFLHSLIQIKFIHL